MKKNQHRNQKEFAGSLSDSGEQRRNREYPGGDGQGAGAWSHSGQGLYAPSFEHDNCGIGAVVNIKGKATHQTVDGALHIVENLEHRAGKDAEGKTGDGVGILVQIPHRFF